MENESELSSARGFYYCFCCGRASAVLEAVVHGRGVVEQLLTILYPCCRGDRVFLHLQVKDPFGVV